MASMLLNLRWSEPQSGISHHKVFFFFFLNQHGEKNSDHYDFLILLIFLLKTFFNLSVSKQ